MTHPADAAIGGPGFGTLSVASILYASALRRPDSPALYFQGRAITYGEMWHGARAYAGAFRARGIGRGSRVAMLIPNVPDFPRVYYAVLSLGAIVVPIHLLFKAEEIEFVLQDSSADLIVVAASALTEALPAAGSAGVPLITVLLPEEDAKLPRLEGEAVAAAPIDRHVSVCPTDAATILYTSGTTGTPKGAVGSHLGIVEQVNCLLIDCFDLSSADVLFGGLPLFHTFGQTSVMNLAFRIGASVVLVPRFDADDTLALLAAHRVTVLMAVPTMFVALLQAASRNEARPALRYAVSGGAALPLVVLEAFHATFDAQIQEGYGLTETSPTVSVNTAFEPIRPGTVGRPFWGVDIGITRAEVETSIEFLGPGELGEVVVRGHNLFKGYLGRPDASAAAVVDGWFRTGDLGTERDGILTIVDRKKDMIVRNGYNVYPLEVEAVLARHPDVALSAVFGVAHDLHGQEVHAAIVPRDGRHVDGDEIVAFMRDRIAAYKYPRVIHVVESLPLGGSGKVLKRKLVEQYSPDRG